MSEDNTLALRVHYALLRHDGLGPDRLARLLDEDRADVVIALDELASSGQAQRVGVAWYAVDRRRACS